MNGKIIFLGGIHGTGKGYISKHLCEILSFEYLSASQLIKWSEINEDAQNKKVSDILDTQQRLMNALEARCIGTQNYILDGHYCLLNSEAHPTKVPIEIFEEINPFALLLTVAEPQIIVKRLLERDGKVYDPVLIEQMQNLEIEYVNEISIKLQVPVFVINSENVKDLTNKIEKLL